MDRIKTGMSGLDHALMGGFPDGNIVLVSGGAGTGKSTFSLQFIVNGAQQFGEKGLFFSTEQTEEELHKHAEGFGWNLKELEDKGLIKLAFFDLTEVDNPLRLMNSLVRSFSPKRIVVDSVTTLTDALIIGGLAQKGPFSLVPISESPSAIPRTEQIVTKSILYKLVTELKRYKITTLLTSELPENMKALSADGISEFIADGVIVMQYLGVGAVDFRSMLIRKMRYSDHDKQILSYDISAKGIEFKKTAAL